MIMYEKSIIKYYRHCLRKRFSSTNVLRVLFISLITMLLDMDDADRQDMADGGWREAAA